MSEAEYSYSTRARILINKVLSPLGISVTTEKKWNDETLRLNKLIKNHHWQKEKYIKGLKLNDNKYISLIDEIILPYKDDFLNISVSKSENCYYLDNEFFSTVDAEVLYSLIRSYQPQNIFEIGSGFSTRVMRMAVNDGKISSATSDNGKLSDTIETPVPEALEGSRIVCIDPQPRVEILTHADEHFAFYVEDLDAGKILNKIKSGDILFIDSSHVVATGGDVNFLFLEILPQLPAGVFIHIHDIFFPFDYPEEWVINERWGWNEQYLVHAFLMFNDTFEIIWPSHYMWVKHKDKINKSFRPAVNNYKPSSLWIKKIR